MIGTGGRRSGSPREDSQLASVSEVLKQARALEKKGDWEGAAVEYRKLQGFDSPPPIAFNLLGDLYHKKGDHGEALAWYEKAIERYAQEGLYGNAIGICRKALRQDRERVEILERLGGLFYSQGLAREAVNHYLLFASSVARRGENDRVIETAGKIRKILPEDPQVREKMAQLLHEISADEEALVEYGAAAAACKENGREEDARRIEKIIADMGGAGTPAPATPGGCDDSAVTEVIDAVREGAGVDMGNGIEATIEAVVDSSVEDASPDEVERRDAVIGTIDDSDFIPVGEIVKEFQDGMERILDDDDYQSHYDLGMSYKEMGLYEEALKEFGFCGGSPAHRTASLEMKVAILIELGRSEEGLSILEGLIGEKEGNEAGCHYLKGVAYEKQGRADKALDAYQAAARIDPTFRNVQERIARVDG